MPFLKNHLTTCYLIPYINGMDTAIKMLSQMRKTIRFPNGCKYDDDTLRELSKGTDYVCWSCEHAPRAACIARLERKDGIAIPDTRVGWSTNITR